jgi:hypothetical protein
MARKVSDGLAVKLTATKTIAAKALTREAGFHGVAFRGASSGEEVVIAIEQCEIEVTVGGGVTAAVGDILYITDAGVITNTSSGNTACLKVTVAKDTNNVVWGILLPQV